MRVPAATSDFYGFAVSVRFRNNRKRLYIYNTEEEREKAIEIIEKKTFMFTTFEVRPEPDPKDLSPNQKVLKEQYGAIWCPYKHKFYEPDDTIKIFTETGYEQQL